VVDGQYGANDMALSLPCIVGNHGLEQIIQIELDKDEEEGLQHSINILKKVLQESDV
jgi:L-lactate dehydrogenase